MKNKSHLMVALLGLLIAIGAVAVIARKPVNPIVVGGQNPYVRGWHYKLNRRAFQCVNGAFGCKECPVGDPNRVINANKTYEAPDAVNNFFGCDDINTLVPEKGYADSDVFICQREPEDGSILMNGTTVRCGK